MRSHFRELIILLGIFLALALPGVEGASFSGTNNGQSINANVQATTASAAGVSYGRGDFHFYGDGDAKYSRRYSTGNTWSQAGVDIKDAENYDGHIGGGKDTRVKTTNAYVDVLAEDAEYINVYGKSGTSKNVGTGVELTVEDGMADVLVATSANGKALTSESRLETNEDGEDAIVGSAINTRGYYTGSKGQVSADVEDGSIEDYLLMTGSKVGGGFAGQFTSSISGDYVGLAASTKKTASGVTKEMSQYFSVYDGQINDFGSRVNDNYEFDDYWIDQGAFDAGGSGLHAYTTYIETSKNSKIKAEQSAQLQNGGMLNFDSGADSEGVGQYVEHAAGTYVSFEDRFTGVDKKATKKTVSAAGIEDGYVNEYWGAAGFEADGGDETGTIHCFDKAQGKSMYLENSYRDNLGPRGGWGSAFVGLGDPAAQSENGVLTGSIEDYDGWATFTADSKTVRSQGYTDQLNVNAEARAYYNQLATDSYSAGDWKNYFITEAKSASPWTVSVEKGHQVQDGETIQQAINTMPDAEGNIFLKETTYKELGIVNNANTANGEVSFTLWGAGSYLDVWDEDGNLVPAGYSVIDADTDDDGTGEGRIFDLYSDSGDRTFTFKKIDFNNGYTDERGGAIKINLPGEGFKPIANIEDSNFNNNHAEMLGGAVYTHGDLSIKNCDFTGNYASWYGGAVLNAGATVNIENSDFKDNYAGDGGGAIEQVDSGADAPATMTLNDCSFINNQGYLGGAILNIYEGDAAIASTITADSCTFDGNTAAYGGAYAAINYDGAGAPGTANTITNSDFTNNVASGGLGAAIYIQNPSTNALLGNTYTGNLPAGHNVDIV